MKTMKIISIGMALALGIVGMVKAGGRQGNGWNVTIVTGTATTIGSSGQRIYLNRIVLSSGASSTVGGDSPGVFLQAFSTAPGASNGGGVSLIPNHLFASTVAVTPSLIFITTGTTTSGSAMNLNNVWTMGDCDTCYLEIPGGSNGLHIRKSAENSGQANQAAVYWSN